MVRYQLERGPIPLHHQVYLDVRGAIEAGEWPVGARLPAERDLADRYGCSLITVRRALDELAREGRLERTRGRGTFVTRPPIDQSLTTRAGFADEMRARGLEPFARVVGARRTAARPDVAAGLEVAVTAPVFFLERIRGADDVPLLHERAWLPADRFPGLLDEDYSSASLYDVLDARFGCPVVRTREAISAIVPTAREARLLGLVERRPALSLEGSAYTRGDQPVEFSRTLVSPERARYFLETSGARLRNVEPLDLAPAPWDGAAGSGGPAAPGPGRRPPRRSPA